MKIGRGTAWVLNWFAKPALTGSIPATASICVKDLEDVLSAALEMIFDGVGGSDQARQDLKAAAFNKAYVPPNQHIWLARQLVTHLRKDRDLWRAKAIEAAKQISVLKRSNLNP